MSIRIFHFANLGFGLPFLDAYLKYPGYLLEQLDIHVILSAKGFSRYHPRGVKRRFQQYYQVRRRLKKHPFRVQWVRDVNDQNFIRRIPEGAVGITSGFNQIFQPQLLQCFYLCLNVHPSVLPYYRGPVPSYWCLKNQEMFTGYTIHEMTEKIDQGKIWVQEKVPILATDSEASLDTKIGQLAQRELQKILSYVAGKGSYQQQTLDARSVYRHQVDYLGFPK